MINRRNLLGGMIGITFTPLTLTKQSSQVPASVPCNATMSCFYLDGQSLYVQRMIDDGTLSPDQLGRRGPAKMVLVEPHVLYAPPLVPILDVHRVAPV